jgi:hypothetical protein
MGNAPDIMGAPSWPGNCEKPALPIWPLNDLVTGCGSSTISLR